MKANPRTMKSRKMVAENPPVRVAEEKVALAATPRRGSLLYKKLAMMIGAAAVVATGANAASVTIDSVTQRWPWNNKIDITYTVTDGQTLTSTGNDVYMRLVFTATIGGNTYTIDGVHDVGASASSGQHIVTWTPPSDLKVKASDCTMTATLYSADNPSGDDYMIVDLDTGVVSFEGLLYSQDLSNTRYTAKDNEGACAYMENKLVLRKVPRGGPYYTTAKTWTTQYDFYVGVFPVTLGQYRKFDSSKNGRYPVADGQIEGHKPVDQISYSTIRGGATIPTDAITQISSDSGTCFLQRLNYRTGNKYPFDLPTFTMAQIANRSGTSTTYHWGGDSSIAYRYAAIKDHNDGTTSEVDAHLPNNWGIYDTVGNLWEHCLDDNSSVSIANQPDAFTPRWNEGANRIMSNGGSYSDALNEPNAVYSRAAATKAVDWGTFRVYCIMK